MPGGIGTLLEIAYTWGLLQCEEISSKKLIVVGKPWLGIVNILMEQNGDYVDETHRMLLKSVDTVAEAVAELEKA
jgi:predicted Rossmann-fold nucleotide-binding protein